MSFRLLPVLAVFVSLGWGLLQARSGDIEAYMARGRELSKAGKIDQALPYFLLSLELAETQLGAGDPSVIPIIGDLAGALAAGGNYRDAEPLYQRALRLQEREAARYQNGIARTLNNLGKLYQATGRGPRALKLYRRVLTTWAPVLGGDHPEIQTAAARLAKLAPPVPVAAAEPAPAGSGFAIHLTSIRNPRDARAEWDRLRRLYRTLLDDLELYLTKADLGPRRGVYYRVKGAALAHSAARARCAAFAARGVWCNVTALGARAGPAMIAARGGAAVPKPPATAGGDPATARGYRVHLTSIRDPKDADAEWRRLGRIYGRLLDGLDLAVARVDLGPSKGVYYRIQGGSLSRDAARALCARFAARDVWCRVARPGEEAAEAPRRLALRKVRRRPPSRPRATRRARDPVHPRVRRRDRGCRRFAADPASLA